MVGPNGSGKSNISDAIRWVLGETSSKQLRGAGKMEDVVFGGTQLRGAMGYASVVLTVSNEDRRIDVDADEVAIGRRYYRSGESEYTINGQSVRLKDIYELFLDTGLGRDGCSIIGQGRIAEIVGAKAASAGKFLKRPPALPNTATAKTRPSAGWRQRKKIWCACGTFWARRRAASALWRRRAKRPNSSWLWRPAAKSWK